MKIISTCILLLRYASNVIGTKFADGEGLSNYLSDKNVKFCYFIGQFSRHEKNGLNEMLHKENIRTAFLGAVNLKKVVDGKNWFKCTVILSRNQLFQNISIERLEKLNKDFLFSPDSFNSKFANESSYYKSTNLSHIALKVFSGSEINKYQEVMNKFHLDLLMLLQIIHNFSYIISSEKIDIDDTYKIAHVLKSNNDSILTGVLQTSARVDKVGFLKPFYKIRTCFFFRRPQQSSISFIKPFSPNTWFTILGTCLIITVLLKVALVVSEAEETSWSLSVMAVLSSLFLDGDDPSPSTRDIGCKLIFLTLLVMSLLLFNYYTSVMVSMLLSPEQNLEYSLDKLKHLGFEIGIDNQPYFTDWAQINFLYKKSLGPFEGINRVQSGSFAYHTDVATGFALIGKNFNQDEICDLSQIEMIPSIFAGLVLPKNSEFFELFQISLQRLRQTGLVHKLKMKWEIPEPECYSNSEVVAVGMEQGLTAFVCLVVGTVAALVILGLEKM